MAIVGDSGHVNEPEVYRSVNISSQCLFIIVCGEYFFHCDLYCDLHRGNTVRDLDTVARRFCVYS